VHEFTREWVKNPNIQVQVITSVYYKSDLKAKGLVSRQNFDGVDVRVLGIDVKNKDGFVKRIWSFVAYAFFSSIYALFGKYDVAIASSGPITAGIPGLLGKWIRRKKMVFEVRDLWPQGAIEMGVIKNALLIKWANRFELICYRSADLIVTLSPGMKTEILAKCPSKRVVSITNAANIDLFSTQVEVDLETYGLVPKKYAIYAGNIGKVNNVEWMVDAAVLLTESNSDIKIVFVGDGQLKDAMLKRKEEEKIENLIFIPLIPKNQLVGFIQHAMVSLVPLANTPVLSTSSPNKLFESIAAGVPVIITTEGWMKEFVELENVGMYVDPDSSMNLSTALMKQGFEKYSRERLIRIAEKNFDKTLLADQFLNELEAIWVG
jgi:glycosyltransferase involved in cell wall biosynthesis